MDWNFPKMLQHRAHITIGSDWGVPESPALFPALDGIVDGIGRTVLEMSENGKPSSYDDKEIKRAGGETILRMLTLSGAEAVGRQDYTGSIEKGKVANFIELDRDLSVGVGFEHTKVLRTWFEGEIVYDGR